MDDFYTPDFSNGFGSNIDMSAESFDSALMNLQAEVLDGDVAPVLPEGPGADDMSSFREPATERSTRTEDGLEFDNGRRRRGRKRHRSEGDDDNDSDDGDNEDEDDDKEAKEAEVKARRRRCNNIAAALRAAEETQYSDGGIDEGLESFIIASGMLDGVASVGNEGFNLFSDVNTSEVTLSSLRNAEFQAMQDLKFYTIEASCGLI